ncbi:MAG: FtsX-like permease family protein, partial [Gemmatimonadota bacterium]|nr:FtsX-like permease family protein [Gemmatimonadota bacterium]
HSNLSLLDISVVQEVLERLLGSVALAIRIMAAFSIACGAVVVVGAAATSRFQRLRESVLLRTLGARTSQVVRVLAVEYAVLGSLASVLGVVLAALAGWVLVKFFFELRFTLPSIPLLALALGTTVVTTAIGIFASWDLVRRSPLAVLRDLAD